MQSTVRIPILGRTESELAALESAHRPLSSSLPDDYPVQAMGTLQAVRHWKLIAQGIPPARVKELYVKYGGPPDGESRAQAIAVAFEGTAAEAAEMERRYNDGTGVEGVRWVLLEYEPDGHKLES
jgi:hypothetical protein